MSNKVEVVMCKTCRVWYNGAEYEQCPWCSNASAKGNEKKKKSSGESSWSWPWKKADSKSEIQEEKGGFEEQPKDRIQSKNIVEDSTPMSTVYAAPEFMDKLVKEALDITEDLPNKTEKGFTKGIWLTDDTAVSGFETHLKPEEKPSFSLDNNVKESTIQSENILKEIQLEEPQKESSTLTGSIQKLGKTTGKYISISDGRTVEPVVGWLLGVKGVYYGQAFSLKNGMNKIGRSQTMDVPLLKDNSVSRDVVIKIVYDSKGNEFNVLPGDSSSLCYVNGQALYAREKLEGFEEFEFGDTEENKFVFVPLCGEHFQWQKYPFK